jgi:hypothetical protein
MSRHARILAEYAAEVVASHRKRLQTLCSCGSASLTVLTVHPSGASLVECDDCHLRWLEEGEELDRTTEAINQ